MTVLRLLRWAPFLAVVALGAAAAVGVAVFVGAGYDPDIYSDDEEYLP